jgi:sugar phosphate isomerase/epimerase
MSTRPQTEQTCFIMTLSSLPVSYCTNVHPGRTVAEIVAGLSEHTSGAQRLLERPIAAGLWFSATAAAELSAGTDALESLAQALWQHDLTCYTLNTFPFGDFHSERVKEDVYLPDWSTLQRLEYTATCARILAQLLPPSGEGSLSTVPLGGSMNQTGPNFHARCIANLLEMSEILEQLHRSTGRTIRLAVEPEPHCHLSSTQRTTVPFFNSLFKAAADQKREAIAREYLGLCFDICHQAVEFETVRDSVALLDAVGVRINKVHISSAVELTDPTNNPEGRKALCQFVEPRYLHQTFAQFDDGRVASRVDLLQDDINREPPDNFMKARRWRVHFHVPVDKQLLGPLNTTKHEISSVLAAVNDLSYAPHLEVETYTWPLMPGTTDDDQQTLAQRISRELSTAYDLVESLRS